MTVMAASGCKADVALAEQLATRLCHDIAGLCGTLVGVLELAEEDAGAMAEALPMAHDMATSLSARLRLLRAAWGPPGDPLDAPALAGLGNGLPGQPRLSLDLSGLAPDASLPPLLARVALNAVLLGAEALPGGGTVALASEPDAIAVRIAGRRPNWPESLGALIAAPEAAGTALREAGPRKLQGPLLVLLAQAAGIGIALDQEPGAATAVLRLHPGLPEPVE